MKDVYKVVWSEGLFLKPHHFQQSDKYFENVLLERIRKTTTFGWGISKISIDEEGVKNGSFMLYELEGIMPDGTLLDIGSSDPVPESRSFEEVFSPTTDSIYVFLTIPDFNRNTAFCNLDGTSKKMTKYKKDAVKVLDENTLKDEEILSIAVKNIRVSFSGESLDGFSHIKIAKITRSETSNYIISEEYIPPVLNIRASDKLRKMLRGIIENMSSRSTDLSEKQESVNANSNNISKSFLFLKTINSFIPVLNHLSHTENTHPEKLYITMVQVLGELMTFLKEHPRELPQYDHLNLFDTFNSVVKKLEYTFRNISFTSNSINIPLRHMEGSLDIYLGELENIDISLLGDGKLFLGVGGNVMGATTIEVNHEKKLKVSTESEIYKIIRLALPGIKLDHIAVPPASFPAKTGYEYFKVESFGEMWESIKSSRSIAIHVPEDIITADFELILLKSYED